MQNTHPILSNASSIQHQFEELKERAAKDALSGLLNRSTAEIYINKRLSNMSPEDLCALFIVDLDNFKKINDTLGHRAGDQAIRQTARTLSDLFRATDIVGRLGGDEFMIFLSGHITEKLIRQRGQEICERLHFIVGSNPGMTLTASVGIYITSGPMHVFDELYQSADQALYKAKRNGKNGFFIRHETHLSGSADPDNFMPVNTIPLSGLLENMDSGVALLEMSDPIQIIYVSPSFFRQLDVKPQSYTLPRPLSSFIHPDDFPKLEQALRTALSKGGSVDYTNRVSVDNSTWMWWRIRATRIDYNNPNPVLLVTTTDISRFKESEQRLQAINERLQSAFEQTTQGLWEVHLADRRITIFSYTHDDHLSNTIQGEFPDFLIKNGWIHPVSIAQFRKFACELLRGQTQGYGNFVIQYHNTGCYGWAALSYRLLFDDSGRPVKAVGIVEQLPQDFLGSEYKALPKRFVPQALTTYLVESVQANLTCNRVQKFWQEGKDLSGQAAEDDFAHLLQQEAEKVFSTDDKQALASYFDLTSLLDLFHQGERWLSLEYRRVDGCGNIRKISHVINLVQDPLTQDVYLFAYLTRLDPQCTRERNLGIPTVKDPITGLYDRATTRALIECQMNKTAFEQCAIAILDCCGLDNLCVDNHSCMNQQRYYLATALSVALGPGCVIGQYSWNQLLVFFPDLHAKDDVKKSLEDAFSFIRIVLTDTLPLENLRFVAGVACASQGEAEYIAMTAQAIELCQLWHNAASDTVIFSQDDADHSWNELQRIDDCEQIIIGQTDANRPLSDPEKGVALQCMSHMLSADSLSTSIRGVLHCIGQYYRADRVYILSLAENRHVITMPYEWVGPLKSSLQQTVSGLMVDRFPILKRCLEERAPIFLKRMKDVGPEKSKVSQRPWRFAVFPMIQADTIAGFFCIENACDQLTSVSLLQTLLPYIVAEQKRFPVCPQPSDGSTCMFCNDLPNLRSYMNVIYSLNSDVYSSLGAVCLDVPAFSTINGSMGFEYGSQLLWYVSKTLSDIFGQSFLFRTWDAEFVVLCPDTIRQVFVGRCNRLRSALQRRYPKDLRIGYTWSDGIFTGKALANEARAIMRCEQVDTTPINQTPTAERNLQNVKKAVHLGQFVVYLQPKINMLTGDLMGAEALVRGLDDAGHLVSPDRFIKELEKSGEIRDLDLYVLDQTLALLDRWREQQVPLIPISVNFSRYTLFDPALPASVLAIQSRYPLLPSDLLEIEITEGGSNVQSSSLSEVLNRFREFGLHFALDDFGSQYANISIFTNVKFDSVKLDRSLISELADNPRGRMLVRDLIHICHSSGMGCVAEGVETAAQINILTEAGCTCAQGYYYDRPLPIERFEEKYLRPAQSN